MHDQRYYGKSLPYGAEKAFTQPYISYLTTEQALADYAVLINSVKQQLNATAAPVIAFGGRYVWLYGYFAEKSPYTGVFSPRVSTARSLNIRSMQQDLSLAT